MYLPLFHCTTLKHIELHDNVLNAIAVVEEVSMLQYSPLLRHELYENYSIEIKVNIQNQRLPCECEEINIFKDNGIFHKVSYR